MLELNPVAIIVMVFGTALGACFGQPDVGLAASSGLCLAAQMAGR